jgi:hypothetical protein
MEDIRRADAAGKADDADGNSLPLSLRDEARVGDVLMMGWDWNADDGESWPAAASTATKLDILRIIVDRRESIVILRQC